MALYRTLEILTCVRMKEFDWTEKTRRKAGLMDHLVVWPRLNCLMALIISGLLTALACGQAPPTAAPGAPPPASKPALTAPANAEPPETVVLKVGDEKFTKADLDFLVSNMNPQAQRTLTTQGRKQLGEQFAALVILSQQARSHQLDQTPAFQHKLALEKEQLQAQAAYDELVQQAKASPEEVSQYYSTHASEFEQVIVRQFVVRKRPPNAAGGAGLPEEEAKARADALRKAVLAGTDIKKVMEDFKAPGEVIIEPEARPLRRGGMRAEMEKAVFALKDGDVSEIFDIGSGLVFFQLTGHRSTELKDASPQIEQTLQRQRVTAAVEDLKKKTTIWMDDQYFAAPAPPPQQAPHGDAADRNPPKP